jgi:hypothetical protein
MGLVRAKRRRTAAIPASACIDRITVTAAQFAGRLPAPS